MLTPSGVENSRGPNSVQCPRDDLYDDSLFKIIDEIENDQFSNLSKAQQISYRNVPDSKDQHPKQVIQKEPKAYASRREEHSVHKEGNAGDDRLELSVEPSFYEVLQPTKDSRLQELSTIKKARRAGTEDDTQISYSMLGLGLKEEPKRTEGLRMTHTKEDPHVEKMKDYASKRQGVPAKGANYSTQMRRDSQGKLELSQFLSPSLEYTPETPSLKDKLI